MNTSVIRHHYENWGNISQYSVKDGNSCDDSFTNYDTFKISNINKNTNKLGTRSERCFQKNMPVSEQLINQNYYSGTKNFTPGPNSYKGKL